MTSIRAAAVLNQPTQCRIRLSADMVARFALLTGDRSSLHVDEAFARRSAYREPVVHGMLPVAFLTALPSLHVDGFRASVVALSGRFAAPVFRDDVLIVAADAARPTADGRQFDIDYSVRRHQAVVTSGTITVEFEPIVPAESQTSQRTESLLLAPVTLNTYTFEEIEADTSDCLSFSVHDRAMQAFVAMIADGVDGEGTVRASQLTKAIHLPNVLAMLLYSTSIGVSLPGASATFLEFSGRVERRVQANVPYRLRGRITHRSAATRILKKELIVTPATSDEVLVRGKASTLIARPFNRMPSIDELKALGGADFALKDKVVLITGASRGIGETTAKLFALHGAKVAVNYFRGADDAKRVVDEIVRSGGDAVAIGADVSSPEEVAALVARTRERFGSIDILVNNAARDYRPVPFLELSWDDIQKDLDVIVKGAFHCCQEVIPVMLQQGGGRIINISTVATDSPPPDQTKYVVAKSALVGLTRSVSIEFAARNIQVNLVVPNFVETDLVAHIPDGFRKKIARDIPMQRAASPVDVARAIVFLASSYASFTTGQKVMVTGGGVPYL